MKRTSQTATRTKTVSPQRRLTVGAFGYAFPAIRGVQAGREYFVSMCLLRLIPKIFLFNEEELVPELRAQRILNKARIPEIARYILSNPDGYAFSALTASIDGAVRFEPFLHDDAGQIGRLHVSMDARFVINDGQHRRAAIETAIRENPALADESIAVVFFLDSGLNRCQQMFADLNRHAIRPSTSLGVLYDHRDEAGSLVKDWIIHDGVFNKLTEMERSTLSRRSRKLFTLSALYHATMSLMNGAGERSPQERKEMVASYWSEVTKQFPAWSKVAAEKLSAAEVRRDYLHSHGIALHAMGRAGAALIAARPKDWRERLRRLKQIDWSRSNATVWEGRSLVGGKVSKATTNVTLTTNLIKRQLGLTLTPEEQRIEDAYARGDHAQK
jgi:DNA sulfur modification protein DndB